MKTKITILSIIAILFVVVFFQNCVYNDSTGKFSNSVTPQDLPSVVPGFNFPEDTPTIYTWLNNQDTVSIATHAWGIWAGLTSNSNQIYITDSLQPDTLLIYETWLGIADIAALCAKDSVQGGCGNTKSTREKLDFPNQLTHGLGTTSATNVDVNPGFFVSVSYSPSAACFATNNLLLNQSTINKYMPSSGSIGSIPAFPNTSITLKPTYYIGKQSDGLIRIPAWQGQPDNLSQVYGPKKWNSYIYADVTNSQTPGKIATPVGDNITNNPPATAIVNLNEFIHYSLDAAAAAQVNTQQGAGSVAAGDLAILVCMHVATKEISNWTWQTFFWTTDPANPALPSSKWQADLRPISSLNGAASHYAVATTYAMVWPNQPISGGTNTGVTPIIGYNPYLEAGLPAPFGNVNKLKPTYQYGMQTNCMSCHAMATTNTTGNQGLSYTADQYVDMKDPIFNNLVQLDFLWSIQGNLNPIPPTTTNK